MLSFLYPYACLLLAGPVFAASAKNWQSRSIYQVNLGSNGPLLYIWLTSFKIMTDRFATSNESSLPCDTFVKKHCGGSWKGIENHLDYISNMGFDAVWISPVVANLEGNTSSGEAYHGRVARMFNCIKRF